VREGLERGGSGPPRWAEAGLQDEGGIGGMEMEIELAAGEVESMDQKVDFA